jgi:acetylornithine deacetylase/succinyl-diaminopimelate desuccinylase-like protein
MQGVTTDFAIIGEPTGMRLQPGNTGYLFVKLATYGVTQHTWCKQNAIDALKKMRPLIDRIEEWEPIYQQRHPHAFMMPRVNVAAIQGGFPFKPSLSAPYCFLYLHVTVIPGTNLNDVKQEIQDILDDMADKDPEFQGSVEVYLARNGYELSFEHPLVKAMGAAHQTILNSDPVFPEPFRYSVSSDGATLDEYGIPAITYGPGGINRERQYQQYDKELGEILSVTNLVNTTKVYAQAIAQICGLDREDWLTQAKPFQRFQA